MKRVTPRRVKREDFDVVSEQPLDGGGVRVHMRGRNYQQLRLIKQKLTADAEETIDIYVGEERVAWGDWGRAAALLNQARKGSR